MQCPDCGYICFKPIKSCGSCGFSFKKAKTSTASLFRNDSFTIFAGAKTLETEQESSVVTDSVNSEDIAVMDPSEALQENPESASSDFLLNLSDAEQESSATDLKSTSSASETMELSSLEFGSGSDINLEEVEVEGLGLGLEPVDIEPPTPETKEAEENILEIIEVSEVDSDIPNDENSDNPIEIASEEEPGLEIITLSPSEDESLEIETDNLSEDSLVENDDIENAEVEQETTPTENLEEETVQVETESTAPVLDLGEDEISLEIDEDFEVGSPAEPPSPPAEIEVLDLNLEIDDSDGPLATTNIEIPEIEIEDLGLELEDSDPSPTSDPEKP